MKTTRIISAEARDRELLETPRVQTARTWLQKHDGMWRLACSFVPGETSFPDGRSWKSRGAAMKELGEK